MGHGLLRESAHRFHKLPINTGRQHGATATKYGEPSVFRSVRVTLQSYRRRIAVCVPPSISGAASRIQRERLATECGKRIRPTRLEAAVELLG